MKKVILFIFIAAALGGILAFYLYNKPVANINDLKPELTVNAAEFFAEFENDEVAANSKYLGKIIEVNGQIRDLKSDESGSSVILESGHPIFGINCGLGSGQEKLFSKYKIGEPVKIRGECAGYDMDVVLTRSVMIE